MVQYHIILLCENGVQDLNGGSGEEHRSDQQHFGHDPELPVEVISSEFDDCDLQHERDAKTEIKLTPNSERLLRAREHVDEECDAAVEEGLDETGLHQNGVVEDVELVQCSEDACLLRSELFLRFQY